MNEVRAALYETLSGGASPPTAATGVYHRRAPQGAEPPYIVFFKQAGTPVHTFTNPLSSELWTVKAISLGSSSSTAEAIAAEIDAVLHDADLSINGHDHLYLRRESDIDYGEPDGADQYQHVGGVYRLYTEPS